MSLLAWLSRKIHVYDEFEMCISQTYKQGNIQNLSLGTAVYKLLASYQ